MDHIVKKSIQIKAAPEDVWNALTNPEKTKQYFFGCKVYSDWKPGSAIVFKGRMFFIIPIEMKGEIIESEPSRLLKYTLHNSGKGPDTISTVTDELIFADGVTTINITDDVGDGEGAEKRYIRSIAGWEKVLKGLKKLVESE